MLAVGKDKVALRVHLFPHALNKNVKKPPYAAYSYTASHGGYVALKAGNETSFFKYLNAVLKNQRGLIFASELTWDLVVENCSQLAAGAGMLEEKFKKDMKAAFGQGDGKTEADKYLMDVREYGVARGVERCAPLWLHLLMGDGWSGG